MRKSNKGMLYLIFRAFVLTALKISKVLYWYTNIETPIYKTWRESHAQRIQQELNAQRIKRENEKFSREF